MRFLTKVAIAGGLIYVGTRIARSVMERRAAADELDDADDLVDDDDLVDAEVVIVGISSVDPEPLSTMGEAIDPDAVSAAHREVPDQLGELPVRGKNIP